MKMKIEELCNFIDSKLVITTFDENYEGILKFISVTEKRLTFEHVYELPSREYLGTMHVLFSSISSLKFLERIELNINKSQDLFHGEFDKDVRIDKSDLVKVTPGSTFFEYLPSYLKEKCASDYCIIDSISPAFFRAMKHLYESSILGASFHGPKISRSGNLTWVCLSTLNCVFLFDVEKLGMAAFEEGLKDVFENKEILKVIHDCRQVADCLLHMFTTELQNVFDTQVADYLINMQVYNGKDIFRHVNSLDSCLFKYLKVPQQFLYNRNKYVSFDKEKEFFQKRPISDDFINVLLKSSMYLLLLKDEQEKLLLSPFEQAVDLYLNSVRSATDSEVHMASTEFSQYTPAALLESVKSIKFFYLPQPPDDFVNQFKDTPHGQKAWQQWKAINNQKDSESDSN